MLLPLSVAVVFIRLIEGFKIIDTVFVLTGGGPGTATETLTLFAYNEGFKKFNLGLTSALSFMFLFVVIIFGTVYLALAQPGHAEVRMTENRRPPPSSACSSASSGCSSRPSRSTGWSITAFKPPLAVSQGPTYFPFIDYEPTLQAFRDAFAGLRGDFVGPIVSSILISLTATALSVFLGTMAAYALVRFTFRIRLAAGLAFAVLSIGGFVLLDTYTALRVPYALLIVLVVGAAGRRLAQRAEPAGAGPRQRRRDLLVRLPADLPAHRLGLRDLPPLRRDGEDRAAAARHLRRAWCSSTPPSACPSRSG